LSLIASLLILSFLIFFHELGHFLFARLFGVKVEVFSIGFGKTVFSKRVGDTDYRISLFPLGGYVKMKGQDDTDPTATSSDSDSYTTKSPWQRIAILFGGPLFNFIFAFFLFFTVGTIGFQSLSPTIGELKTEMVAYKSGIREGDKIISINGEEIEDWRDLSSKIVDTKGDIIFEIERNSQILEISLTPEIAEGKNIFGETIQKRMVGILPNGDIVQIEKNFIDSIIYGFQKTVESATLIFQSVQKLLVGILSLDQLGGVISIFEFTAKATETGLVPLLLFTALMSVNLGVLNLLPIPALDGGHIIFNIYELIFRKAPNEDIMYRLTLFGWGILLSLMVIGLYNDISRLVG
jgi:regulator of sigma E protease